MNKKLNLNWKFSKHIHRLNRTMSEIIASMRQSVIDVDGCLHTKEEAVRLTEEIRKELRERGEIQ